MFKMTFFSNLKQKLTKTRNALTEGIKSILSLYPKISEDVYNSLEEILIEADIGVSTTMFLVERLKQEAKKEGISNAEELLPLLKKIMYEILTSKDSNINWVVSNPPHVTLVVGVNGTGKTTTAGKISALLNREGKK